MNRNFLAILIVAIVAGLVLASPAVAARRGAPPLRTSFPQFGPGGGNSPTCLGPFWSDADVAAQLNLTDDQVTRLEEAHLAFARAMIDLDANVRKAQLDLDVALRQPKVDEADAKAKADALMEAQRQLMHRTIGQQVAVQGILTQEQAQQLRELQPDQCRGPRGDRQTERRRDRRQQ